MHCQQRPRRRCSISSSSISSSRNDHYPSDLDGDSSPRRDLNVERSRSGEMLMMGVVSTDDDESSSSDHEDDDDIAQPTSGRYRQVHVAGGQGGAETAVGSKTSTRAPAKGTTKPKGHDSNDSSTTTTTTPTEVTATTSTPVARGGVACPFPWKLHDMLEYAAETPGCEDIVAWDHHGTAFCVLQPKLFVQLLLPIFFLQSKYASFQRQLNLYGFERDSRPRSLDDTNGANHQHQHHYSYYSHPMFVRGQRQLVVSMIRCKVKGTGLVKKCMTISSSSSIAKKCKTTVTTTMKNVNKKTSAAALALKAPPATRCEGTLPLPPASPSSRRQNRRRRSSSGSATTTSPSCSSRTKKPKLSSSAGDTAPPLPTMISPVVASSSVAGGITAAVASADDIMLASQNDITTAATKIIESLPFVPSVADLRLVVLPDDETDTTTIGAPNTTTQKITSLPEDGDLLFFEGNPFHYLDSCPSMQNATHHKTTTMRSTSAPLPQQTVRSVTVTAEATERRSSSAVPMASGTYDHQYFMPSNDWFALPQRRTGNDAFCDHREQQRQLPHFPLLMNRDNTGATTSTLAPRSPSVLSTMARPQNDYYDSNRYHPSLSSRSTNQYWTPDEYHLYFPQAASRNGGCVYVHNDRDADDTTRRLSPFDSCRRGDTNGNARTNMNGGGNNNYEYDHAFGPGTTAAV